MEERIIKLETLSALQDETIRNLNQEIFRQQQDLSHLRGQMEKLENKFDAMQSSQDIGGNERPPHW